MFDSRSSDWHHETVALLALMSQHKLVWNNKGGGMVEEEGSAVALLERLRASTPLTLFEDDTTTDSAETPELLDRLDEWDAERMRIITVLDEAYPVNLRLVHDRPAALWVRGELRPGDERSVAVVGARKASEHGIAQAGDIARGLVDADFVVVSGLAEGIDTAAHTATLDAGGRTVAVVGTGLRESFPKASAALQERLGRESAVISQFWPDQGPRRRTFLMRNAVMSGLAWATVVVEATGRSGARMQARLALEHGRPVFLLRSLLEHDWAREYAERPGTYLVDTAADVVASLDRLYSDEAMLAL